MRSIALGVLLFSIGPALAQDWPQWRGPQSDNKVAGFSAPKTWPKELTRKWSVTVGVGESSPVLVGDKLYVFSRQADDEVVLCLDAGTGKEVWKEKYAAEKVFKPALPFPGPRSTPAVGEGKVCTLGVGGVVSCWDATTGKLVWRDETKTKPLFNTSTSPIIVDGKCIVFAKGLTAYDLTSGKRKWDWTGAEAPYGSPVIATLAGVKQVVTPAFGMLAGINMADGKLLWKFNIGPGGKDYFHHYSTPLVAGDTVYYSITPGKGKGGAGAAGASGMIALKIEKKGDAFTATERWKKSAVAAAGYHTPTLKDGLIFGVTTGTLNYFCVDAKTGEQLWIDKTKRGTCGSILDVGPVLLSLTGDKQMVAFKASGKGFEEVAKYTIAADAETWSVPIVAGNRVFVKDKGGSLTLWTIE